MHTTRTESEREKCKGSDRGSREIQREKLKEREMELTSVLRLAALRLPLSLLPLQFYI